MEVAGPIQKPEQPQQYEAAIVAKLIAELAVAKAVAADSARQHQQQLLAAQRAAAQSASQAQLLQRQLVACQAALASNCKHLRHSKRQLQHSTERLEAALTSLAGSKQQLAQLQAQLLLDRFAEPDSSPSQGCSGQALEAAAAAALYPATAGEGELKKQLLAGARERPCSFSSHSSHASPFASCSQLEEEDSWQALPDDSSRSSSSTTTTEHSPGSKANKLSAIGGMLPFSFLVRGGEQQQEQEQHYEHQEDEQQQQQQLDQQDKEQLPTAAALGLKLPKADRRRSYSPASPGTPPLRLSEDWATSFQTEGSIEEWITAAAAAAAEAAAAAGAMPLQVNAEGDALGSDDIQVDQEDVNKGNKEEEQGVVTAGEEEDWDAVWEEDPQARLMEIMAELGVSWSEVEANRSPWGL